MHPCSQQRCPDPKTWKLPKWPLTEGWADTTQRSHTEQPHLSVKGREVLVRARTWINSENLLPVPKGYLIHFRKMLAMDRSRYRKQISVCWGMRRDRNWGWLLMGLGFLFVVREIKWQWCLYDIVNILKNTELYPLNGEFDTIWSLQKSNQKMVSLDHLSCKCLHWYKSEPLLIFLFQVSHLFHNISLAWDQI